MRRQRCQDPKGGGEGADRSLSLYRVAAGNTELQLSYFSGGFWRDFSKQDDVSGGEWPSYYYIRSLCLLTFYKPERV